MSTIDSHCDSCDTHASLEQTHDTFIQILKKTGHPVEFDAIFYLIVCTPERTLSNDIICL